jgi:hypothetical protein
MKRLLCATAAAAVLVALGAAPSFAQSACPSGYHYQASSHNCVSTQAQSCPTGYHVGTNRLDCISNVSPSPPHAPVLSCPSGYTLHRISRTQSDCMSTRPASCPTGKQIHTRTGQCVTGIPQ